MSEPEILMEGVVFGESPRWHDGRLWFSDWGANQVISLAADGSHEVVATVPSFPMCIDFLPDGRLLIVDSAGRRLLRREPDGTLVPHADLATMSDKPWNDIVVDDHGNAYVNNINFDFPGGDFTPGLIALVTPDGTVERAADDLAFPNGMAISPDGATLIVAESYANRLTAYDIRSDGALGGRRVWAETPGDHPDGICLDAEGAVWYADVGNQRCVRVREGGAVLATVNLDRGAFACVLSREPDPRLFVVGQAWGGPEPAQPSGQVVAFPAPAPGAGHP
ncbi:SMP-30/gluconolactonase/LRE family protein [Micromonospora zingiberis]|uniref:SMP-30/gluconolactonase/LRE family protein n=1 Tax=Micromonospora zingiberis TaxID=2053011 RepID=A0A4R0GH64_9ACTN|nr:SMP-30/gluconolactonase/LRE family protein [Micromonospora zingiberis]TCB95583.1 SMP-30/gluconolactonase/LRE family protein [Micromonospora zingiberis]